MAQDRSDYSRALGRQLRSVRTKLGLSLLAVETNSRGRWKATAVSSYERADREITVAGLVELAEFYGVPPVGLLPQPSAIHPAAQPSTLVIDLQRVVGLPADRAGPLARYAAALQSQRGAHNGKTLTIRNQDLRFLAIIYDTSPQELMDQLMKWKVLRAGNERHVKKTPPRPV